MKRFLFSAILFALVVGLLSTGLCVLIDPFNVFHPLNIRDNGVEPDKNYVKMTYILNNPDKFNAFLFGSSRVCNIHTDKIPEERVYNMTMSVATPMEHLDNIKTLLQGGIVPKHIYIGVDVLSYTEPYENHKDIAWNSPYEYSVSNPVEFYGKYLVPSTTGRALVSTIIPHALDQLRGVSFANDDFVNIFYDYGWVYDYGYQPDELIFGHAANAQLLKSYISENLTEEDLVKNIDFVYMDEAINSIEEIARLCEQYDMELTVFTNPLHYTYLPEMMLNMHYAAFLQRLTDVVPYYYNFCGFSTVNSESSNYIDVSHPVAEVGDMMIERICFGTVDNELLRDGFGMIVTKDNVDELVNLLTGRD